MFSAAGEYFQKKESYDEHTDRIRKGYREMILVSTGVDETVSKVMGIIGLSASVLWFVFFIASLIADNFWPLVIGLGALVVLILLVFVIAKIVTNSTLKKKAEQLSLSQESDLPLSAEMNNYNKDHGGKCDVIYHADAEPDQDLRKKRCRQGYKHQYP